MILPLLGWSQTGEYIIKAVVEMDPSQNLEIGKTDIGSVFIINNGYDSDSYESLLNYFAFQDEFSVTNQLFERYEDSDSTSSWYPYYMEVVSFVATGKEVERTDTISSNFYGVLYPVSVEDVLIHISKFKERQE